MLKLRSILILFFILSASRSLALQPGDKLLLIEDRTTVFSQPGYTYQNYEASKEDFQRLRELGLQDMIPRKVGFLTNEDVLEYIDIANMSNEGKPNEYYYQVRFKKNGISQEGYVSASLLRPAPSSEIANSLPLQNANSKPCNSCTDYNLGTICQANLFADISRELEKVPMTLKSSEELADYMYPYRKNCRSDLHKKYVNEYSHYIQDASQSFQVPEALLTCLLFKENQWDQGSSHRGAVGIAQIMPNTIVKISKQISMLGDNKEERDKNKSDAKEWKEQINNYEQKIHENIQRRRQGVEHIVITPQETRDYNYYKSRYKNYQLSLDYRDYADRLKTSDTFKENYPNPPWGGEYPTRFNRSRAKTPPLAIGASALELSDIMQNLKDNFDSNIITEPDQMLDFLVFVAGAYNMGTGNAERLIGSPPPKNVKDWVKKLNRYPETKKHMESIRRCMEKGNNKPPLEKRGGRYVDQNRCGS